VGTTDLMDQIDQAGGAVAHPGGPSGPSRQAGAGARPEHTPLSAYAGLLGVFGASFLGFVMAARPTARPLPTGLAARDVILLGVATHKLSRLLAKSKPAAALRAPFTEPEGKVAAGEVEERARGSGLRRAVGELLTCPFCVGLWIATALNYGLVLWPALTHRVCGIFATLALSDFLNLAYVAAAERAPAASPDQAARDAAVPAPTR
jgi:hypothetical protein